MSRVFQLCGLATAAAGECPDVADYAACLGAACASDLARCFGSAFAADDFRGGACEAYVGCVTGSPDPCATACDLPTDACGACLEDLVGCFQRSSCAAPACASSAGDGGSPEGDGGSPGAGGGGPADAGGPRSPPISGTCADLRACCEALAEPTQREACLETLAAAEGRAGDSDCAVVVSSYRAAGICAPLPPAP